MITTMLTLAPLVALVVSLSPSLLSVLYGRSTTSKMNRHPIWCPFYARRGNSLRAFFFLSGGHLLGSKYKKASLKGWQVEQQGQRLLLTSVELVLDTSFLLIVHNRRL
ncbi:hypothetical protein CYU11_25275 [Vibrio parahaemolyticus]|nr:hypothetical protein CYU11_25275 [Vibrio parahaemolyticus]